MTTEGKIATKYERSTKCEKVGTGHFGHFLNFCANPTNAGTFYAQPTNVEKCSIRIGRH